jgi:subtilisin family serine protease
MISDAPMKKRYISLVFRVFPIILAILLFQPALSDEPFSSVDSIHDKVLNWYNLDPVTDNIQGAAVDRAYNEILRSRVPLKKIVVAVVDGGVDIHHNDLQGKIWKNEDEIPDNGMDDDHNGYIDDVHGWNFLGNSAGENILFENYEYVRIYKKYDSLYRNIHSIHDVPPAEQSNYRYYLASRKKYQAELKKTEEEKEYIDFFENSFDEATTIVKTYLGIDTVAWSDIDSLTTDVDSVQNSVTILNYLYNNGLTPEALRNYRKNNNDLLNKKLNPDMNYRAILSDDPSDILDTDYGNNDVKGPTAQHGTFVSGIIAAIRDNGEGVNGIAGSVEIMVLRAVPDGDEYDKDIALAIRYATDNGANIINMSFGKSFSPYKKFVDEALRYAGTKNVLLVHSAGNDANNIDENMQYPSKAFIDGTIASNYITVGATAENRDDFFVADFSNYGRKNVDLFAPGMDIVSLHPDNKYNSASGTSFSGPVVSGVAALIWSYYPDLNASEIKDILLQSVTRYERLKVYYPTDEEKKNKMVKFKRLSQTGGIVNAYNAMQLAEKKVNGKKPPKFP